MELIIGLFQGTFGALCMVALGLLAILFFHFVVPFKIAVDSKRLFKNSYSQIAFACGAVFFPLLSIGYLFHNPKQIRMPLGTAVGCLVLSVGIYLVRSFISTMFV